MENLKKHLNNFSKRIIYIFSNTNYRIKYNTIKIKSESAKNDFAMINLHKDEKILKLEKEIEKLKATIKELNNEESE